jgi:hypothetical protein
MRHEPGGIRVVSWGPITTAVIESRTDGDRRVPVRVPLSAIFQADVTPRDGVSRQTPLRGVVNGHGE